MIYSFKFRRIVAVAAIVLGVTAYGAKIDPFDAELLEPRYFADAPVEMMTVSASIVVPSSIVRMCGRLPSMEKSTEVTMPMRISAPSEWCFLWL